MTPLASNSPLLAALRKIRAQREAALAEVAQLEQAPVTDDELRARIAAEIAIAAATLRELAQPALLRMPGAAERMLLSLDGRDLSPLALLALLQLPAVGEALAAEAHAADSRDAGLPAAERSKEVDKLRRRIADLEEAEELEVLALEAAGHVVARRDDCDSALLVRLWSEERVG